MQTGDIKLSLSVTFLLELALRAFSRGNIPQMDEKKEEAKKKTTLTQMRS